MATEHLTYSDHCTTRTRRSRIARGYNQNSRYLFICPRCKHNFGRDLEHGVPDSCPQCQLSAIRHGNGLTINDDVPRKEAAAAPEIRVTARFVHPESGHGELNVSYTVQPEKRDLADGLWVMGSVGHKRSASFAHGSFGWQIREPDQEMLSAVAQVVVGLMPLGAFADWLEERREWYEPEIEMFEDGKPDQWARVVSEMRRIATGAQS